MNVLLDAHFSKFVEEAVASGRFGSSSEVVREGLRLLEERETRLGELRREIDEGRRSGDPIPYDPATIKSRGRQVLSARKG